MICLEHLTAPPISGSVTSHENDGHLYASVPDEALATTKNWLGQQFIEVSVGQEPVRTAHSKQEARDAFSAHKETAIQRIMYAYYEEGWEASLKEMAECKGEGGILDAASGLAVCILRVFGLFSKLQELLPSPKRSLSTSKSPLAHGSIVSVAWHPHTNTLAAVFCDDTVRVFSAAYNITPLLKHRLQKSVSQIAWMPYSASQLAVGCEGGILIWTLDPVNVVTRPSGSCVMLLSHPSTTPINAVSWHPKGNLLACAGDSNSVLLVWDVGFGLFTSSPDSFKKIMFNPSTFGSGGTGFGGFGMGTSTPASANPMKDFEVVNPPDDSIQCMAFSPPSIPQDFLVAGSWDNNVRCWEVQRDGKTIGKAQQTMGGPIMDVAWHDDGSKVFMASADKTVHCWDLGSNQKMQVAQHEAPVKTVHWIKAPTYSCIMTGSWDKTLKFWDTRSSSPILTINLPERCYCADVEYPMAVVGTANRHLIVYQLEGQPQEYKQIESPLKYQHRCVAIFKDKKGAGAPAGFALGSVEGRVAIQYIVAASPRDNFTFKCHRSNGTSNGFQDIYAVNDIKFHPVHGTLATVGSDGRFSFWDKDARTKLKNSEAMEQPISCCAFNHNGQIFAYAVSYDWSKGHEFFNPQKKNYIFLRSCYDELKPRR